MINSFDFAPLLRAGLPPAAAKFTGVPKYNFVGGHGDPDQFPVGGVIAAANSALRREGRTLATYGFGVDGPQGHRGLREFLIKKLKSQGIPVVTVFLSGRPLWTNPEINASDAFVAAWLPGTEGGGIADVILGTADKTARNDFRGKLTFSWPKYANQGPLNVGTAGYDPLFAYGYGLTYADIGDVPALSEDSGLSNEAVVNVDTYFAAGRIKAPWQLNLIDGQGSANGDQGSFSSPGGVVMQNAVDAGKQEAGRSLVFTGNGRGEAAITGEPVDLSRQTTGKMTVGVTYRLDAPVAGPVYMAMGSSLGDEHAIDIASALTAPVGEWATVKITLDCFVAAGVDVSKVGVPFSLSSEQPLSISYSGIRLASDEGDATCPAK